MRNTIFILTIISLLYCCKKTESKIENNNFQINIDTIFPGDYFPAYPNSFWKYINQNGDTIVHTTDSCYRKHYVYFPYDTSLYYAPLYDGRIVKKYLLCTNYTDYHGSSYWERIISDSLFVNNTFLRFYLYPISYNGAIILTVDTSVVINSIPYDSVIIIKELCGPSGFEIPISIKYYAKHIGLIKKIFLTSNDSISDEENIFDYFVNN